MSRILARLKRWATGKLADPWVHELAETMRTQGLGAPAGHGAMMVHDFGPYTTSTDYGSLWDAAQVYSVVCFVDYSARGVVTRDVAHTLFFPGPRVLEVSGRGVCYLMAESPDELAELAPAVRLEWLPPCP